MNKATPSDSESMTRAVDAFADWRAVRRGREPTPERLQRMAAALLAEHRAFHICKALRINATALKQWAADAPVKSNRPLGPVVASSIDRATAFVELPRTEPAVHVMRPGVHSVSGLRIDLPSGMRLTLTETMAIETLSTLLQALPPHLVGGAGAHA